MWIRKNKRIMIVLLSLLACYLFLGLYGYKFIPFAKPLLPQSRFQVYPGSRLSVSMNVTSDGSLIAYSMNTGNGDIYLFNTTNHINKNISNDQRWESTPVFSNDSNIIAFIREDKPNILENYISCNIYIYNISSNKIVRLTNYYNDVNILGFSQDSRLLFFVLYRFDQAIVKSISVDGYNEQEIYRLHGFDVEKMLYNGNIVCLQSINGVYKVSEYDYKNNKHKLISDRVWNKIAVNCNTIHYAFIWQNKIWLKRSDDALVVIRNFWGNSYIDDLSIDDNDNLYIILSAINNNNIYKYNINTDVVIKIK